MPLSLFCDVHEWLGFGVEMGVTICTPWTHVFPPIDWPVQLNVLEAVEPRNETAKMMTAAIKPSRTAYSTAVAPSSLRIAS